MQLSNTDKKLIRSAQKILIIGDDDHGKNSVIDLLVAVGYSCIGTSEAMCNDIVYPLLKDKYHYQTPEDCFEDRDNCREDWYRIIADYCKDDSARLLRTLFSSYQVVHGCRSYIEFLDAKHERLFDLVLLVDASQRKPPKITSSFKIPRTEAHYVIDNNKSKKKLIDDPIIQLLVS